MSALSAAIFPSHAAAQVANIYIPIFGASTVYFAQPDALNGSLVETLREVRPTVFFAVPRYYNNIIIIKAINFVC